MAAPTVTRPVAVEEEQPKSGFATSENAAQWAKYVIIGALAIGVAALIAVAVATTQEKSRVESSRKTWDEVFLALKDKTKPEERIAALEGVAPKIAGTTAHAYVLMLLGDLYFEDAIKPEKYPEEKAAALQKSIKLFELVATSEPYKNSPAYGALAVECAALAHEQGGNYDAAIKLLNEAVSRADLETHYLYNKLVGDLGRMYYMRSLQKPADSKEAQDDRELARKKISDALRAAGAKKDDELAYQRNDAEYIKQLEFIRSLVEKPGSALPDGKAPPVKLPKTPVDQGVERAVDPAKKDEPKKEDTKKEEPKKEEPKKEEKKADEKKSGALEVPADTGRASVPASASGHVSFAQIQQMLKEGRTAFCHCPRCDTTNIPATAKLIE
jgi:tetratricopeptide (TPR) repeat protein